MSGGTVVPRHECPGGHFFQGDSHASDSGTVVHFVRHKRSSIRDDKVIEILFGGVFFSS